MHVEIPDSKISSSILKRNIPSNAFFYVLAQLISNVVLWLKQSHQSVGYLSVVTKLVFLLENIFRIQQGMLEAEAIWPPDETETNFMHS